MGVKGEDGDLLKRSGSKGKDGDLGKGWGFRERMGI